MQFQFLGWEDPLEEGMATHSSILSWRIPQTEETSRLQSMLSQRVGHSKQLSTHPNMWSSSYLVNLLQKGQSDFNSMCFKVPLMFV